MTAPSVPDNLQDKNPRRRSTRFERLRSKRRTSFRRWVAAHIYDLGMLFHEARVPLTGFFIVMASGTLYWTHIYENEQYGLGAALYETMTMLALEQDTSFPPDPLGQFLFFAIPIFGLAFIFQGVLDFGRLLLSKNSRMEDWQRSLARTYKNHIIVVGLGSVSYRIVLELLEAGYDVVVIEQNWESEFVRRTMQLKVPVVHGDALEEPILAQAGLWRSHALVVATSNDLLNIKIGLEARRIRPALHVVLRVFNDQLDRNLEQTQFGPNTVFSSSALAAPTLAAAAVCRGIHYAMPLDNVLLGVTELTVTRGGFLDSRVETIEERFGVQIIAYQRTETRAARAQPWNRHVRPRDRLYGGDKVLLLGTLYAIGEAWQHGQSCHHIMASLGSDIQQHLSPDYNIIVVCGLGTVGYRVVRQLYRMEPRPEIVVVYNDIDSDELQEEVRALDVTMIRGDARTKKVLYEAGIDRAYSVVAVTSDKLTNVQICLTARQIRRDIDLVLRVFSDELAQQLEGVFGIQTTYSTSVLASTTMAAAAVVRGIGYAIDIGDQLLSTTSFRVRAGDEFVGQTITDIREQHGLTIIALWRGGQQIVLCEDSTGQHIPDGPALMADDKVVVLAEIHTAARLHHQQEPMLSPAALRQEQRQLSYPFTNIPTATWPGKGATRTVKPLISPPSNDVPRRPIMVSHHWLEQLQRVDSPTDIDEAEMLQDTMAPSDTPDETSDVSAIQESS